MHIEYDPAKNAINRRKHRVDREDAQLVLLDPMEREYDMTGATCATEGSYRRVMRATSLCVFKDLPFTLNMVLVAHNRGEVGEMISLAGRLGSRGVRFGHLMPTPETALRKLDLSPQVRREVESDIWRRQKDAPLAVGMAPGYFSTSPFFPCARWSWKSTTWITGATSHSAVNCPAMPA